MDFIDILGFFQIPIFEVLSFNLIIDIFNYPYIRTQIS